MPSQGSRFQPQLFLFIFSFTGAGEAYLESQGIDYDTDWDMGQNLFAMGAITVICLLLAYLQLRFSRKYK